MMDQVIQCSYRIEELHFSGYFHDAAKMKELLEYACQPMPRLRSFSAGARQSWFKTMCPMRTHDLVNWSTHFDLLHGEMATLKSMQIHCMWNLWEHPIAFPALTSFSLSSLSYDEQYPLNGLIPSKLLETLACMPELQKLEVELHAMYGEYWRRHGVPSSNQPQNNPIIHLYNLKELHISTQTEDQVCVLLNAMNMPHLDRLDLDTRLWEDTPTHPILWARVESAWKDSVKSLRIHGKANSDLISLISTGDFKSLEVFALRCAEEY